MTFVHVEVIKNLTHPDWQYAKYMIDYDKPFEDNITFGKDGKALYVSGPYD